MARVLAIDIGTSSVRAALYGQSLQPLRQATQVRYRWRTGSDGSVEAAPAAMERTVAQAIDGALDRVTTRVEAVAIAAFWHSLLGVDAQGRAVTSVIPWSDTRSARQVEAMRERLDERAIHARTGCRIHSTYWPARLRWFADHEPKTFRRARRWMSFPTYLQRRWLGRDAESLSQASGTGHVPPRRLDVGSRSSATRAASRPSSWARSSIWMTPARSRPPRSRGAGRR